MILAILYGGDACNLCAIGMFLSFVFWRPIFVIFFIKNYR